MVVTGLGEVTVSTDPLPIESEPFLSVVLLLRPSFFNPFTFSFMPRLHSLKFPEPSVRTKKNARNTRVLSSPRSRRGAWQQQQYLMKFISRKIARGSSKSRLMIRVRRNPGRTPGSPRSSRLSTRLRPATFDSIESVNSRLGQAEAFIALPIVLPQLPQLVLPCTTYRNQGCQSELNSLSSPCSERRMRRYIRPELLAASPLEYGSCCDSRIRLSAAPLASDPSPFRFLP
ncbi:hypothetical protein R3P38DRAFT_2857879 [Favolaschia claudopus]|uniref:Ribosomal protein L34 n=1 Tax=Favolaschia claudopus TaxID=2862362 RepID=A0AAW0DKY2_9AGAR